MFVFQESNDFRTCLIYENVRICINYMLLKKGDRYDSVFADSEGYMGFWKNCSDELPVFVINDFREVMREVYMARKIQRAWRKCVSDPEYNVCKKRLMNEFRGLDIE